MLGILFLLFFMPFKYNGKIFSKILVFFSGVQWRIQARICVLLDLQEKIVIEARPLSQISPGPSGVIFTNILATIEVIRCLVCSSPWRRRIQGVSEKSKKHQHFTERNERRRVLDKFMTRGHQTSSSLERASSKFRRTILQEQPRYSAEGHILLSWNVTLSQQIQKMFAHPLHTNR